jgi:uncharacterized protein (TIGR03118 family)
MRRKPSTVAIALATGLLGFSAIGANAGSAKNSFIQTNLVSNRPGEAQHLDPNLQNPWGISASGTSPMWVSDNAAGVTTLYNGAGQPFPQPVPLVVTIPPAAASPPGSKGVPTGTVFNDNAGAGAFRSDRFLFATEDGAIAGWKGGPSATIEKDNSLAGAVYKGLAIDPSTSPHLYAANFHAGTIDVFDSGYNQVALAGSFNDARIPADYAPFNVQNLGGVLYVTYAMQDADRHDDVAGRGHGFVDAFDVNGNLLGRLVSHGQLDSPWGLAIAPASFGAFGGDLLVGNFGDGRINAFTLDKGNFRGTLKSAEGPIAIDGLWALRVGNGGAPPAGGDPNAVYFTAGINDEVDGLFGTITNAGS